MINTCNLLTFAILFTQIHECHICHGYPEIYVMPCINISFTVVTFFLCLKPKTTANQTHVHMAFVSTEMELLNVSVNLVTQGHGAKQVRFKNTDIAFSV